VFGSHSIPFDNGIQDDLTNMVYHYRAGGRRAGRLLPPAAKRPEMNADAKPDIDGPVYLM